LTEISFDDLFGIVRATITNNDDFERGMCLTQGRLKRWDNKARTIVSCDNDGELRKFFPAQKRQHHVPETAVRARNLSSSFVSAELNHHSLIANHFSASKECARRGSNAQPSAPEADALSS